MADPIPPCDSRFSSVHGAPEDDESEGLSSVHGMPYDQERASAEGMPYDTDGTPEAELGNKEA